jgi:hypothetical protein
MRVYLAGPSRELPRVREAAAAIRAAGHELTSTWHERDVSPSDAENPDGVREWLTNSGAILGADRVIAMANRDGGLSQGVREEVCFALGISAGVLEALDVLGEALAVLGHRGPSGDVPASFPIYVVGNAGPSLALTACIHVATLEEALR